MGESSFLARWGETPYKGGSVFVGDLVLDTKGDGWGETVKDWAGVASIRKQQTKGRILLRTTEVLVLGSHCRGKCCGVIVVQVLRG